MALAGFKGERQQERRRRPDGFHSKRENKGHPRRRARQERAAERAALHVCGPTCKRFRTAA